jgi:hypothetical protein
MTLVRAKRQRRASEHWIRAHWAGAGTANRMGRCQCPRTAMRSVCPGESGWLVQSQSGGGCGESQSGGGWGQVEGPTCTGPSERGMASLPDAARTGRGPFIRACRVLNDRARRFRRPQGQSRSAGPSGRRSLTCPHPAHSYPSHYTNQHPSHPHRLIPQPTNPAQRHNPCHSTTSQSPPNNPPC